MRVLLKVHYACTRMYKKNCLNATSVCTHSARFIMFVESECIVTLFSLFIWDCCPCDVDDGRRSNRRCLEAEDDVRTDGFGHQLKQEHKFM